MTQVIRLRRPNTGTPWGFRLNGGAEFGQVLYIHKVTAHSIAMKGGLHAGDAILQIGIHSAHNMTHEAAKMEIIRAGNELDLIIQRQVVDISPGQGIEQPRGQVLDDQSMWRGGNAQNPNVQSKSFKILQQQLGS